MSRKLHQGDVLLCAVSGLPADARPLTTQDGKLAVGEVSGHAHRFEAPELVTLFATPDADTKRTPADVGVRYIQVLGDQPILLLHEEHNPVAVPPGVYSLRFPFEWDYEREESRQVAD